jgi:hypothetical protein
MGEERHPRIRSNYKPTWWRIRERL